MEGFDEFKEYWMKNLLADDLPNNQDIGKLYFNVIHSN